MREASEADAMFQLAARQRPWWRQGVRVRAARFAHREFKSLSQRGTHKATSLQHCKTHVVVSLHELAFACDERQAVL